MSTCTDYIYLFKKRNESVRLKHGMTSQKMKQLMKILYKEAGNNLRRKDVFQYHWNNKIKLTHETGSKYTTSPSKKPVGVITWFVRLGDVIIKVWLGVLRKVSCTIIPLKVRNIYFYMRHITFRTMRPLVSIKSPVIYKQILL